MTRLNEEIMTPIRITLIVCAIAALLVSAGCGGGSQPPVPTEPQAGQSQVGPGQEPTLPPTRPPASAQPEAGRPPTATIAPTDEGINLAQSNQPGSTIA